MLYKVDDILAVILAGALVGALLSRWTSRIEPARLARIYFVVIAVILAFRTVGFVCGIILTNASIWNMIGAAIGDVGSFLFGALLGIAALRTERRQILCRPRDGAPRQHSRGRQRADSSLLPAPSRAEIERPRVRRSRFPAGRPESCKIGVANNHLRRFSDIHSCRAQRGRSFRFE